MRLSASVRVEGDAVRVCEDLMRLDPDETDTATLRGGGTGF